MGINYGKAMMGIIGQEDRMEPAILSDAVNLAARLESLTKQYKVKTAFSDVALHHLEGHQNPYQFRYRLLDHVRVVGKKKPVKIYELLFPLEDAVVQGKVKCSALYEKAIQNYFARNVLDSYKILRHLSDKYPEDLAIKNYLERCLPMISFDESGEPFSQDVPEEFDPIYDLTSK